MNFCSPNFKFWIQEDGILPYGVWGDGRSKPLPYGVGASKVREIGIYRTIKL